jgi:hypothetical protein
MCGSSKISFGEKKKFSPHTLDWKERVLRLTRSTFFIFNSHRAHRRAFSLIWWFQPKCERSFSQAVPVGSFLFFFKKWFLVCVRSKVLWMGACSDDSTCSRRLISLSTCPHTTVSVSSYYYICVLILLYVRGTSGGWEMTNINFCFFKVTFFSLCPDSNFEGARWSI